MSSILVQLEWPHVNNRLSLISSINITSTTSRFETAHPAFGRSKRLGRLFHGKSFTRFDRLQQESHVHVPSSRRVWYILRAITNFHALNENILRSRNPRGRRRNRIPKPAFNFPCNLTSCFPLTGRRRWQWSQSLRATFFLVVGQHQTFIIAPNHRPPLDSTFLSQNKGCACVGGTCAFLFHPPSLPHLTCRPHSYHRHF